MVKKIIAILLLTIIFQSYALAEDVSPGKIILELLFPKPANSAMKAPRPIPAPQKVAGTLVIDIAPIPDKIEKDRYLAEYFLNDQLIYQTTGLSDQNPRNLCFSYALDTTKYANGQYKLIVNFWDRSGPSAIGIKEITISNAIDNGVMDE